MMVVENDCIEEFKYKIKHFWTKMSLTAIFIFISIYLFGYFRVYYTGEVQSLGALIPGSLLGMIFLTSCLLFIIPKFCEPKIFRYKDKLELHLSKGYNNQVNYTEVILLKEIDHFYVNKRLGFIVIILNNGRSIVCSVFLLKKVFNDFYTFLKENYPESDDQTIS